MRRLVDIYDEDYDEETVWIGCYCYESTTLALFVADTLTKARVLIAREIMNHPKNERRRGCAWELREVKKPLVEGP